MMSRDTRVSVSTRVGKFTVRVYDEEAYQASIAQYYQTGESTSTALRGRTPGTPVPFPKKSRVKWVTPIRQYASRKGA